MSDFFNGIAAFLKELNIFTVSLRIVLAVVFGGIIGFERGRHGSQAGMRTHILVCLGGAMTSLVGVYCTQILGYNSDPLRISAQVVSGIGFLGAGMIIIKSDKMITGLTTAAIMWSTAIIGIAAGIGFYSGAFIAMLACVFTAAFLTRLERNRKRSVRVYIEVDDIPLLGKLTEDIKMLLPEYPHIEIVPAKSGISGHLGVSVVKASINEIEAFRNAVEELPGVFFVIIE